MSGVKMILLLKFVFYSFRNTFNGSTILYKYREVHSMSTSSSYNYFTSTMQLNNHALIGAAADIPVPAPTPVTSYSPVVLSIPNRPVPLELRISFPATGTSPLPIILLSHGHGRSNYLSSLLGYTPLSSFYASHGFCVVQPTHLSSRTLCLDYPEGNELWWKTRPEDMSHILDRFDEIEGHVGSLKGRLDRERVVVVGHSLGALTANMLLGMVNTDPRDNSTVRTHEKRIKAGVILTSLGSGGTALNANASQLVPFYGPQFDTMTSPALVVCGDEDVSPHFTDLGADWHEDAYKLSPGPKSLFNVKGGKHLLGGISGWDAKEAMDESPEMLAAVQRVTWAYLWSQLYSESEVWEKVTKALEGLPQLGAIKSK